MAASLAGVSATVAVAPARRPRLCRLAPAVRRGREGRVRAVPPSDSRSPSGPMGSRDMDELTEEIGKLDLDAVTQQFGDNFGPRPDFFKERTVGDLKEQFEGLIDLEEVGGVFSKESGAQVTVPMDQEQESEDAWSEAQAREEEIADEREQEDMRANEEWGAKWGWERATDETRAWYDAIQDEFSATDPLAELPKEEYEELSNFIMKLVHAGKNFDALVDENIDKIDEKLLMLLERRAALAAQDGSDVRVVHGLQKIWKRLAAEMERRDAPDELKLLDTCLAIMMPEDPMEEFDAKHMLARKQEVVELLDEAFALPLSQHRPVDLFDVARKIGPQQKLDIDKLEAEHGDIWGSEVTRQSFIELVREVVQETEARHAEEYEALKEIAQDLESPDSGYSDEEKLMAGEEIEQMHREMDAQKRTLGVTREVLRMAEAMKWV